MYADRGAMEQIFEQSIYDLIRIRHSVRSFENEELDPIQREKIRLFLSEINQSEGIFGGQVRVELIEKGEGRQGIKLGTYGVINGARYYLAVACKQREYDLEDLGFLFEKVILFCTSLGLGTVWIGGTFHKGNFAQAINLEADERLPIISPLGLEGGRKSLLASMFGNNNLKRKEFGQLFFDGECNKPLLKEEAYEYARVLEMVRIAPSSVNTQPWRIVKEADVFHFFSEAKTEANRIDMGICLCHFYLAAMEKGLMGEFKIMNVKDAEKANYLISWVCEEPIQDSFITEDEA